MMMWENWLGLKSESARALDIHPAVSKVHITIRNEYKYFRDGIRNCPFTKLEHFLISLSMFLSLCDFAYMRKISPILKTFNRRPVISSHAALELAQTKIQLFDDRIICSMAATNVRVFPVP